MDGIFDQPHTVVIPIRFGQNGEVSFFYGGSLPAIKESTVGDLIVPAYAVSDERKLALLEHDRIEALVLKGTPVMALVIVRTKQLATMAQDLSSHLKPKAPNIYISESHFIEIRLEADLRIRLRGTKLAALLPCECTVPALHNKRLRSLNQAFSAISEVYQQHRSTHIGNVFARIYVESRTKDTWVSLGDLRNNCFRTIIEYRLLVMCRPWWYRASAYDYQDQPTWALLGLAEKDLSTVYLINKHSVIFSEQYFAHEDEARAWLEAEGYTEFDSLKSPRHLTQPEPPYKKPNGEERYLSLERAVEPAAPSKE